MDVRKLITKSIKTEIPKVGEKTNRFFLTTGFEVND